MIRLYIPAIALLPLLVGDAAARASRSTASGGAAATAQGPVVTVRVVEDVTGQPLPNAEAIDLETDSPFRS
jgi:hypothetical protein